MVNIAYQQVIIGVFVMLMIAGGGVFYFHTLRESLKSPDYPFQTPLSAWIMGGGIMSLLGMILKAGEDSARFVQDVATGYVSRALAYITGTSSTLTHRARSQANDPESAGSWELLEPSQPLDLSCLDSPASDAQVEASAIQWIIETCTLDTEIITAAVIMLPEVEWPEKHRAVRVSERLEGHFHTCFDPTLHLIPLKKQQAETCVKAICHVTRAAGSSIRFKDQSVCVVDRWYYIPRSQGFLLVSCALGASNELDIASLPPSERMWLAYMFTLSARGHG